METTIDIGDVDDTVSLNNENTGEVTIKQTDRQTFLYFNFYTIDIYSTYNVKLAMRK